MPDDALGTPLPEAGLKPTTVARRLSVLRGTYQQLAVKGLMAWEMAQDIGGAEELDPVLDPEAGDFAPRGDPDRDPAGDP